MRKKNYRSKIYCKNESFLFFKKNFSITKSVMQDRFALNLSKSLSKGAVGLRDFSLRRHRNFRLNKHQLIFFKKKRIFERKKLSMEIFIEEFKPM